MLAGKRAVVLGGTGVLGQTMVEGLVEAGAEVVLVGRSQEKLDDMQSRLGVQVHACDPSDFSQLESVAESVGC
ncbi:MAG: SDR family NAD(P)-dependent oxidoreductase, partial [Armatimonadota bacterium]